MRFFSKYLKSTLNRQYFHGSTKHLSVGVVLQPTSDYEQRWGVNWWYQALEKYRPKDMLSHKSAVFMCDNPDDVELAGGGADWIFTVEPLGKVERHDVNWTSELEGLLENHDITDDAIAEVCKNYWAGVPHPNESVWEYLTPQARILKVEEGY